MRCIRCCAAVAVALLLIPHTQARAAALRIDPVLVDVLAPGSATTLTLRNDDLAPLDAQIRLFRWIQNDGAERLEPTDDVVASPPAVTVPPHSEYTVRIVRISKQAVAGEESYRLLIDQLPDLTRQKGRSVAVLIRQSIPVFFGSAKRGPSAITWSITAERNNVVVEAQNGGDSRLKISALKLRDTQGHTVSFGDGLVGYVLPHSRMRWSVIKRNREFDLARSVSLSARGDEGPIHALLPVPPR